MTSIFNLQSSCAWAALRKEGSCKNRHIRNLHELKHKELWSKLCCTLLLVLLLRFSNQIMCHNLLLLPIRYLRHVTLAVPSPSPGGSPASSSSACCQSSSGASAPPTELRETSPAPESLPRMFGYTWPRCNLQTLCSNVCWIVSDPSSHQESSPVPPTE